MARPGIDHVDLTAGMAAKVGLQIGSEPLDVQALDPSGDRAPDTPAHPHPLLQVRFVQLTLMTAGAQ